MIQNGEWVIEFTPPVRVGLLIVMQAGIVAYCVRKMAS